MPSVLAVILVCLVLYAAVAATAKREFSGLYWWCVALVFALPAMSDTMVGLPMAGMRFAAAMRFEEIENGIRASTVFAVLHVAITLATYRALSYWISISKTARGTAAERHWVTPGALKKVLWVCLVGALAAVIVSRGDLTRDYNDFLDDSAGPEYETYFLLAASPLAALLFREGRKGRVSLLVVCAMSAAAAYLLGVRYYTFPFIVYVGWQLALRRILSPHRRIVAVLAGILVGTLVFGVWAVARESRLRDRPLTAIAGLTGSEFVEQIVGMELAARVSCYDLMTRMRESGEFRGAEVIGTWFESALYPRIMSWIGAPLPTSNSKLIYELQSGVRNTGVSTGATVFGNDWFSFGWSGVLVGGVIMGLILFALDEVTARDTLLAAFIGPMATYQLIFFARGGTDVWLGLWGRVVPLWLVMAAVARVVGAQTDQAAMIETALAGQRKVR